MTNDGAQMTEANVMNTPSVAKRYEFDRLPRESTKAFAAFRAYLDLGPDRSLAAVAAKVGKSTVLMKRWSRKYDWSGRVAAHVGYVAEVERLAIEGVAREKAIAWHKVHEEQRVAEWNARCRMLKLANRLADRWEQNEKRTGTPQGIARLFELASRLGRLSSGMPTEGAEVSEEIKTTLEIEWEMALQKVYGRAKDAVVDAEVIGQDGKREIGNGGTGTEPKDRPPGDGDRTARNGEVKPSP